ncbi:unnamed protein product, partial [Ectocarpus sp. 12 AP-2014]
VRGCWENAAVAFALVYHGRRTYQKNVVLCILEIGFEQFVLNGIATSCLCNVNATYVEQVRKAIVDRLSLVSSGDNHTQQPLLLCASIDRQKRHTDRRDIK